MDWKDIIKLDRAKLRRREKESRRKIDESNLPEEDKKYMRSSLGQDLNAEEQDALDSRADKRRKMGLKPASSPRSKRIHRMKPEDRPKPRRRATEEELRQMRSNKPPKMGDRGSSFRGQ
tara:strand:- start:50 stop:406 length:357 start_codon:yes stop_codon:yes gene_type:complete